MSPQQTRIRRAEIIAKARGILDAAQGANRSLTSSEAAEVDRLTAEAEALSRDLQRNDGLADLERDLVRGAGTIAAHRQWEGRARQTREESGFARFIRDGNPAHLRADSGFSELSDAEGGYLVPSTVGDVISATLARPGATSGGHPFFAFFLRLGDTFHD